MHNVVSILILLDASLLATLGARLLCFGTEVSILILLDASLLDYPEAKTGIYSAGLFQSLFYWMLLF